LTAGGLLIDKTNIKISIKRTEAIAFVTKKIERKNKNARKSSNCPK
jgi:hypothetical protein